MFHVRHSKEGTSDSKEAPAQSIKAHGAQRHKPPIFSLGTRWRKVSTSRCGRSTTGGKTGTQWMGIVVHTAAVLRVWEKRIWTCCTGREKDTRVVTRSLYCLITLLPGQYAAWSIYCQVILQPVWSPHCQVTIMSGHYTARSLYRQVNILLGHNNARSLYCLVTILFGQYTAWSLYWQVTILSSHYTAWSLYCLVTTLPGHYTGRSIYCQVTILPGHYTVWSLYWLVIIW